MQVYGVLIVEQDSRVRRVLSRIIKRMGYEPYAAADYENFKTLYTEKSPAVILLSLEMVGNQNSEFCRYLVEQRSQAVIILLSNLDENETSGLMQLGLSAGLNMSGVLRKPVDVESIKELLAGLGPRSELSALKKSLEHGRLMRSTNHKAMNLDPDQRPERRSCIKYDSKHLKNHRPTILNPILLGVIP